MLFCETFFFLKGFVLFLVRLKKSKLYYDFFFKVSKKSNIIQKKVFIGRVGKTEKKSHFFGIAKFSREEKKTMNTKCSSTLLLILVVVVIFNIVYTGAVKTYVLDNGVLFFQEEAHEGVESSHNIYRENGTPDFNHVLPWPMQLTNAFDGSFCHHNFDSLYVPHLQAHTVESWIFDEVTYGQRYGSVATEIDIYNVEELISYMYSKGVWNPILLHETYRENHIVVDIPQACRDITDNIKHDVIAPLIQGQRIRHNRLMTVSAHGITARFLCNTPETSKYVVCTPEQIIQITRNANFIPLRQFK